MKNKYKKIKSGFVGATIILMSGSIIAQILAVCISPIMTRLYSASEIGKYTLILTAVSMFGWIICLRYDASIVIEEEEKEVFSLLKLSGVITIILSSIIGVGYSMYCYFQEDLDMHPVAVAIWVFVLLLFSGIGHILVAYNNRQKEYKLMSSVGVIREIGRDISLTIFGVLHLGTIGLLISQSLSVFLGLNRQAKSLKESAVNWKEIRLLDMQRVAKKHIKQPLYSVPANFLNNFSYSILNIFVSNLFGVTQLAYYSMSFRLLGLPITSISANMSKVFFEKAAREYEKEGNFKKTFLVTTFMLSLVAVPMVVVLMLLAPLLFGIFFGAEWSIAGVYVKYLAPMFGIRLVVSALTPTMIVTRKQNLECVIQSMFLVGSIIVYLISSRMRDIYLFLKLISIVYSIVYILYYFMMLKLCKKN